MSRESNLMRKALREHLQPQLTASGFSGGPVNYSRFRDDLQDVLSVQFWKYGGSFILEFGYRTRGPLMTTWGEAFQEDAVTIACLPLSARARLQNQSSLQDEDFAGFRFKDFGEHSNHYDSLAIKVAELLPQVDT